MTRMMVVFVAVAALVVGLVAALPAAAVGPYPDLGSCPVFPAPPASTSPTAPSLGTEAAWNQNISKAPRAANSAKVIAYINSHGGNAIHPDFGSPRAYGFPYAVVGAGAKKLPIHYTAYGSESSPGPFPIPANAPVEGGAHAEGDRHVLVVDKSTCKLFELYNAAPAVAAEAALGRRRRGRMGPPLGGPAARRLDLRRRCRPADLPRPRPLRRSGRGPRRPRDPGHHGQHPQRLDPPRLPLCR